MLAETSQGLLPSRRDWDFTEGVIARAFSPVQLLASAPCFLFLTALAAMLLRPPEVRFYELDRIAFAILVVGVCLRAVVLKQRIIVLHRASLPMIALTVLVLASVAGQPFDHETWSALASKFIVPFTMFHIAGLVFTSEARLKYFEAFSLIVLAYLSFIAVAFFFGMHWLIVPRFVLDSSLGVHAGRARGPFLQAVANGVSLNLLALLALHRVHRAEAGKRVIRWVLASVPIAILATMTRAVWLSFAASIAALVFLSPHRPKRRIYVAASGIGIAAVALALGSGYLGSAMNDRLKEDAPIEFRQAVYAGGWEMFLQRPVTGWGFHRMPDELPRHVVGYSSSVLYPHNTYLELLAENGILGFALYAWLMWELWRLRRSRVPIAEKHGFLSRDLRLLWPMMLGVYWLNASVVVMSYQFVNAFLFTMAGMLAAQSRRAEMKPAC
jgi:O-antigen ligase